MLIVCNGAPKSGSTWLYNIADRLCKAEWPDRKYLTKSHKHPTIRPESLHEFLEQEDFVTRNVITKTHYGQQRHRDLLLARPHTRVLDMNRNLYDVIVSTYYDSCRRDGFVGSFEDFYWFEGRGLAEYLLKYHQLWGDGHPQVLVTTFEGLKTKFNVEVRRIAEFLQLSPTEEDLQALAESTKLDSLREQYKDDPNYADPKHPFFRKGEIGDWRNHFDERMLSDIAAIEKKGLSRFDWIECSNSVRRRLASWFPQLSFYRKPGTPA
jgi:hypothetical protein